MTTKYTRRADLASFTQPADYRPRRDGETLRAHLLNMAALEVIYNDRVDAQYAATVAAAALGEKYEHAYETHSQKARNRFVRDVERLVKDVRGMAHSLVGTATNRAKKSDDGFGSITYQFVTVSARIEGDGFRWKASRPGKAPVVRWDRKLAEIAVAKLYAEANL